MPPAYIEDLDEYIYWLQQQIENSGGHLASEYLRVVHLQDDAGEVVGFQILRDCLVFKDTELTIRITIDESMSDEEYNFHFQRQDGTLVFGRTGNQAIRSAEAWSTFIDTRMSQTKQSHISAWTSRRS